MGLTTGLVALTRTKPHQENGGEAGKYSVLVGGHVLSENTNSRGVRSQERGKRGRGEPECPSWALKSRAIRSIGARPRGFQPSTMVRLRACNLCRTRHAKGCRLLQGTKARKIIWGKCSVQEELLTVVWGRHLAVYYCHPVLPRLENCVRESKCVYATVCERSFPPTLSPLRLFI